MIIVAWQLRGSDGLTDCGIEPFFFVDGSAIQVRKQLTNAEIHLAATNTRVDADDLFKLPLDQVVALGAGHDPLRLCLAPPRRSSMLQCYFGL